MADCFLQRRKDFRRILIVLLSVSFTCGIAGVTSQAWCASRGESKEAFLLQEARTIATEPTAANLTADEETTASSAGVLKQESLAGRGTGKEGGDSVSVSAFSLDDIAYAMDNIFLFVCAVLVIFMQAGFGMLEAGLNAAKHTVNVLFKNLMDLTIGVVLFFLVGFGLMYPGESGESWLMSLGDYHLFGFGQVGISASESGSITAGSLDPQVFFLFQVAFAATAATIVSGAVAGRMKFVGYLIFSAVLTGLIYPISGAWTWGGGFLTSLGFTDFAGSVIVHAVGGFAGLAGAIVLGPREGRYDKRGNSTPIPGHNLTFAALGVFVLWVGWYGFNPGSLVAFSSGEDAQAIALIATNTTLAPAAATLVATGVAWCLFGKPDLTMALNGALAGLVGITAGCNGVTNGEALFIGAVAGGLVVGGIVLLDRLRIDDPVGAWPVHGLCGMWGAIATGLFVPETSLLMQLVGTGVICSWAFITMLLLFLGLRRLGCLRVTREEELVGLDVSEHGMQAYPGVGSMEPAFAGPTV